MDYWVVMRVNACRSFPRGTKSSQAWLDWLLSFAKDEHEWLVHVLAKQACGDTLSKLVLSEAATNKTFSSALDTLHRSDATPSAIVEFAKSHVNEVYRGRIAFR